MSCDRLCRSLQVACCSHLCGESACALGDLGLGAQVDGEAHQPAEAGSNGPTNVCVDFFLHASPLALKLRQLAERRDELVEKGILDVLSPFARLQGRVQ